MTNILLSKPKNSFTVIHQFLFLQVPISAVSEQVILWGESMWWPKECLWKYVRQTDGQIRVGTEYVIKINKPSASDWAAEITQLLPNRLIECTFTRGLFKGFERIILEERANGTRMDYELHFKIRGLLNIFLWPFVLRNQYMQTINKILSALKNYLVEQTNNRQDDWTQSK